MSRCEHCSLNNKDQLWVTWWPWLWRWPWESGQRWMWSFWLEWEQSSYLLNHQGKKEPKSRSLIRTSTSILKGSQEAELTCEAAGEATRSSVSGKPELDGEGGILFPAPPCPSLMKTLLWFCFDQCALLQGLQGGGRLQLEEEGEEEETNKVGWKISKKESSR